MASYWKSQPRKFCEVCKCWLGDNKASIDFHEKGKSHQEKKKKQLDQIRKRGMQQAKENAKAGMYMEQIEKAAKRKFLQDLKDQGVTVNEEEYQQKVQATKAAIRPKTSSISSSTSIAVTNKDKIPIPKSSAVTQAQSTSVGVNILPSSSKFAKPYGKWTVVENPSESSNTQPFAVAEFKPVKVDFTEKTVSSVTTGTDNTETTDNNQPTAFKKRKVNNRNIRSKLDS